MPIIEHWSHLANNTEHCCSLQLNSGLHEDDVHLKTWSGVIKRAICVKAKPVLIFISLYKFTVVQYNRSLLWEEAKNISQLSEACMLLCPKNGTVPLTWGSFYASMGFYDVFLFKINLRYDHWLSQRYILVRSEQCQRFLRSSCRVTRTRSARSHRDRCLCVFDLKKKYGT